MTSSNAVHLLYILFVMFISSIIGISFESVDEQRKVHIVYMGSLPEGEYLARHHHVSLLQTLGHNKIMIEKTLMRSYTRSFNGFVANLSSHEVSRLKTMKGVVSIFMSRESQTQTTSSWDYIGLSLQVSRNPVVEGDIIIGHLDSGVLPESHSFFDHGLGPIPKKWKGACHGGKNFTCNKKLIGARFYNSEDVSAEDLDGHGTHTASTAVGREVENANFFGIANGTARGGVSSSRLATYKVCRFTTCFDHDILAGFDDAIADNVDIITISISSKFTQNISDDVVSIGSFHAMEKNILTVNAAGNNGISGLGSTDSIAPWVFTVGASADRSINNKLVLENDRTLMSTSVNAFEMSNYKKLVYGRSLSSLCDESNAEQCTLQCVDPHLVKGNIMVCDIADSSSLDVFSTAESVGASGVILRMGETMIYGSRIVPLPTAILNDNDFNYVKSYLKSKTIHSARIMKSEILPNQAPAVAYYSSKGPNTILPQIFKPDISAPGTNILAAFLPSHNPSFYFSNSKTFKTNYTFMTGTSMSCPHVAGAVAYVKSKHLDWSASAIKSSLMTTARDMNFNYNLDAELGYGAGYIDPVKAVNPGLVYETYIEDYFKMFCGLGSEGDKLTTMFKGKTKCTNGTGMSPKDLNYPAMTSLVLQNSNFTIKFSRTVTNVGQPNSTYQALLVGRDSSETGLCCQSFLEFGDVHFPALLVGRDSSLSLDLL
ncbi:subtilisin-like protease SBT4.3 [Impatiens glandulifera]|uniref:subtilisin-like protease SBT4.3 n=1 Tax=Impatiens glandulifera TaxID=253017 RepID=UPI001FB18807|nr:subtilisin-like protease SBT4.3 [Impatiens glandulifera]